MDTYNRVLLRDSIQMMVEERMRVSTTYQALWSCLVIEKQYEICEWWKHGNPAHPRFSRLLQRSVASYLTSFRTTTEIGNCRRGRELRDCPVH